MAELQRKAQALPAPSSFRGSGAGKTAATYPFREENVERTVMSQADDGVKSSLSSLLCFT
jgi:hypothetical protein